MALDPSRDYTEEVPMGHSLKWIDSGNLEILIREAMERAYGDPDHELRFALEATVISGENEDWMASEYGSGYWTAKGELEERAEEYRQEVFGL